MEIGQSYHIFNHANGREDNFLEEENYRFFLKQPGSPFPKFKDFGKGTFILILT